MICSTSIDTHFFFADWVFDIPALYHNCQFEPEVCEALGAIKLHEFDRSVNATREIHVKCQAGERQDGLPDWTWYAENYKFHRPMPG